jgi:hypothetical protein
VAGRRLTCLALILGISPEHDRKLARPMLRCVSRRSLLLSRRRRDLLVYDLNSLGWNSFQQLCLTITREVIGQTVESFLDSKDGGRDGAFSGTWRQADQEEIAGQFVIQCKFTSRANHSLVPSELREEVEKTERLVRGGMCDVYILMTNAGVSGVHHEVIKRAFRTIGVKYVRILGSTWIEQQIRENKRLRMLVPRVYGLGDLSQILDERAYAQARAVLESFHDDLAKVVVTDVYRRAAEALDRHGFVLLIGEPAAGKTTIASLLAMAALDQWRAPILKLDEPSKVVDHWNPDEPSQFFWLDDAFGVTQYENFLVHSWNHVLPQIRAMLRKGAKIVMTSRDYVYNRARHDLKEGAFPLLKESQVVVDVLALSPDERCQILYNHIKLGTQPASFRREIKPFLELVAVHPRFIPETARRLADPIFTRNLFIDPYLLGLFVEKREILLQEVLSGLDGGSKAALALIYMRRGKLESPVSLRESERDALGRLGCDLGGALTSLEALNGSLVSFSHSEGESFWKFKHPTIGDAYAAILVQSPELLGILLEGSAPETLVQQITCGDVDDQGAVVVPRTLFALVLSRLEEFSRSPAYKSATLSAWRPKDDLQGFLSRRCSREFLSLYLARHPAILDSVSKPGLYPDSVSEVDLAVRLNQFGLLPEMNRKEFVKVVSSFAVDGEDVAALRHKGIRTIFSDEEFETLVTQVRHELIPRLSSVRIDRELEHDQNNSAEEHMQTLLELFDTLKECYVADDEAVVLIESEMERANLWITENTPEELRVTSRKLGRVESQSGFQGGRSIFDDIDN